MTNLTRRGLFFGAAGVAAAAMYKEPIGPQPVEMSTAGREVARLDASGGVWSGAVQPLSSVQEPTKIDTSLKLWIGTDCPSEELYVEGEG